MSEREGKSRRRSSIPWGLIGAIALIALGERYIARHERESFTTNVAASWKQAGRAAQHEALSCDVLCFGDSMIKFGIAPRVIEERTGLSAYNLAVYGGPPPTSYFLLRRVIEAGGHPRAVVVDFAPHLLKSSPQRHTRHWQEMATTRECFDLARTDHSASFFAEMMVGKLLPSVRDRYEIRANIMHAFRGQSYTESVAYYITPLWRNWRLNRGGQLLAKNPAFKGEVNPEDHALFPAPWSRDAASTSYMRRFLDLAAAHKITVYWLFPPNSPGSQAHLEEIGVDGQFTGFVHALQDRYANLIVLDARHSGYADGVFTDPVHLDRYGTAALSVGIAGILRRQSVTELADTRWIAVPHCPERPIDAPLEDLDQSRLVLKEQQARK
jgi:hypothetical protein